MGPMMSVRRLVFVLAGAVAALACWCAPALASYSDVCAGLGEPLFCTVSPNMNQPDMVAVSDAAGVTNGDVYVASVGGVEALEHSSITRFNAKGEPVGFTGSNAQIEGNQLLFPKGAVRGVAVESATGDFYVTNNETEKIERFDAEGALIGSFALPESAAKEKAMFGIAVDESSDASKGDIYVVNGPQVVTGDAVYRFVPNGGTFESPATPFIPSSSLHEPQSIAVGHAGAIYVANHNGAVKKFNSATGAAESVTFGKGEGAEAVATDPSTGHEHVFVWAKGANEEEPHVLVYSETSATAVEEFDTPGFGAIELNVPAGLAVNPSTHEVYATNPKYGAETDSGAIFSTSAVAKELAVETKPETGLSQTEATLHAKVKCEECAGAVKVKVHFAFGAEERSAHEVTVPSGGEEEVSETVTGLTAGGAYQYKALAEYEHAVKVAGCKLKSTSKKVTTCATGQIGVGWLVSGGDLPAGTTVTAIKASTELEVSAEPSASSTAELTFSTPEQQEGETEEFTTETVKVAKDYALTVDVTPAGAGSVQCDTGGGPGSCAEEYTEGTTVKLTQKENAGYAFEKWSGACSGTGTCEVFMSEAKTVTAEYKAIPKDYALTVDVTPAGAGSVQCDTGGGPGSCAEEYTEGTTVKLTEKENAGYTFEKWSGACSGTGTCEVLMSEAKTVTAEYKAEGVTPPEEKGPTFAQCATAAKEDVEWTEGGRPKRKQVYTGRFGEKECKTETTVDAYREKGDHPGPEGKYELTALGGEGAGIEVAGKSKSIVITTKGEAGNWQVIVCGKSTLVGGELWDSSAAGKLSPLTIVLEKCEGKSDGRETVCKNTEVEARPGVKEPVIEVGGPAAVGETAWSEAGAGTPYLTLASGPSFECGSEAVDIHGVLGGTLENTSKGIDLSWAVGGADHAQAPAAWWSEGAELKAFFKTRWYTGSEDSEGEERETTVVGITALKPEAKGVSVRNQSEVTPY